MREPSVHNLHATPAAGIAVLLAMTAVALIPQSAAAQAAVPDANVPVYDVVSIRPNNTGSGSIDESTHHGNYRATNVSLKELILETYGLQASQLFGLPNWCGSTRFDIQAKIITPDSKLLASLTKAQRRSMLRLILTDRFHLQFHREWKVLPVYDLLLAKDGPKFQAVTPTEITSDKGPNGVLLGTFSTNDGRLTATGIPLSTLVGYLSDQLNRVVVNKTGLTGEYSLQLKWSPDNAPPSTSLDAPPDFFTALQEQLGLRLEPSKANIQTFVIDHVEMPSEN